MTFLRMTKPTTQLEREFARWGAERAANFLYNDAKDPKGLNAWRDTHNAWKGTMPLARHVVPEPEPLGIEVELDGSQVKVRLAYAANVRGITVDGNEAIGDVVRRMLKANQ